LHQKIKISYRTKFNKYFREETQDNSDESESHLAHHIEFATGYEEMRAFQGDGGW